MTVATSTSYHDVDHLGPAVAHGEDLARTAMAAHDKHLSRAKARLCSLFGSITEVSANGAVVTASDGREFLNCGGYGVFFVGAGHPRIVAAVQEQLHRQAMSTRVLLDPVAGRAATALAEVAPPGLDRVHFSSSGAEAAEAAIKLARMHGRDQLISMTNGYHGKTMGALSLTAKALYQDPFRPLLGGVRHVPFGDTAAITAALRDTGERSCVVVEPVQSEAGVIVPPPDYLREVAEACRAHGALLVMDEVMTGLGRLGAWWGCSAAGVVPDMVLVGKALSGGVVPVAATLATDEVFAPFNDDPYIHTSTYGGAPIAMAAAAATIEVIESEGLVRRAGALGTRLIEQLRVLTANVPHIVREVRGAGTLIGVELADAGLAGEFMLALLDHGVIANHSLNAHPVVRFTPPAVFTAGDEARLLDAVRRSVDSLGAQAA